MHIEIPGYTTLNLKYLLLDYNGTIALDGRMNNATKNLICESDTAFDANAFFA